MAAITHRIEITGRYTLNGQLIDCPACGADSGLVFVTFAGDQYAVGGCPNQHAWDDHRVPAEAVREAVEAARTMGAER